MAEERTIRVTGRGELRVKPDTVRLTLTIGRTEPDFAAAVDAAEKASAAAVAALAEAGAAGKDVRALSLRTEPHYETIADENGVRTRKFAGYSAVRRIRAELGTDPAALGRALTLLAACGAAPEIAIIHAQRRRRAARRAARTCREGCETPRESDRKGGRREARERADGRERRTWYARRTRSRAAHGQRRTRTGGHRALRRGHRPL